jgi:hypothetical protein
MHDGTTLVVLSLVLGYLAIAFWKQVLVLLVLACMVVFFAGIMELAGVIVTMRSNGA